MEIGLNLVAALENGIVYDKDILFVPEGHYLTQLQSASSEAFNLSIYINYYTKENIPVLLRKAKGEADALALNAGIITSSNIGNLLGKARNEAQTLEEKANK